MYVAVCLGYQPGGRADISLGKRLVVFVWWGYFVLFSPESLSAEKRRLTACGVQKPAIVGNGNKTYFVSKGVRHSSQFLQRGIRQSC